MYIPSIEDIIGIDQTKLGFFQEWQRKLMELRVAHAESERQRLVNATILDSITDLMMVLDEDLRIVAVNTAMEKTFPDKMLVGKHCYSFFTTNGKPCTRCPAKQSLEEGSVCREVGIFHVHDHNLHFDMVASPLPQSAGNSKSVLMLKREVTSQKQLQAKIYQAEKMASLGVLAAGVAHEINNPLTAIVGFAEGIRRRVPTLAANLPVQVAEDIEEYINTILQESNRCRDIVHALMNFSRPLPSFRPIVLGDLVKETLSLLRHTLKKYDRVLFCLDIAENPEPIWVDDTQIRQVLINLVTNALDALPQKYSHERGETTSSTITIRTAEQEDYSILQVEDTGTGILPEHMNAVFEPFFTTKPMGLGLGLSLCYTVMQTHGGDISLTRTNGKTIASIRLPKKSTCTLKTALALGGE